MHYSSRTWDCPLCSQHPETFAHLFFDCAYSTSIIRLALTLGNWNNVPHSWDDLMAYLISFQGTILSRNILCLSVAISFYKVWEARNIKIHGTSLIPPANLAKDVTHHIKSRLSTCKSFLKATSYQYYCNWLLYMPLVGRCWCGGRACEVVRWAGAGEVCW